MYDVIKELELELKANEIPCQPYGSDPRMLYYPTRSNYVFAVKQYEDDDCISLYRRKEWLGNFFSVADAYEHIHNFHFKARKAIDFVQEEIGRLKAMDSGCPNLSSHARNLNLMALEGNLFRAYGRENEVNSILRVMLRKTKPNVLLTGQAGCGKTAIVENLAFYLNDSRLAYLRDKETMERAKRLGEEYDEVAEPLFKDMVIYDLDISALCAGTKYRGEFEEKIRNILNETRKNPNIILFIDEIHQINELGGAEGASGMGQLIKPALARGDLHCIGATTDEEAEIVFRDKALTRRFNKVKVLPLGGASAINVCAKILEDYSKAHGIKVEDSVNPADLFAIAQDKLKATAFPDNYINLVDEAMATAKFNRQTSVSMEDFNATTLRLVSADVVSVQIGFGF